jgi:DNA-binding MarR family transcriptional regulator
MAVASADVRAVQASYPRIYLACHIQHTRRTPSRGNLTESESNLLGHLDKHSPARASTLARHMGVSRSSLSATIKRLFLRGYVARDEESGDRRAAALRLSAAGARAMQAGSVLDTSRVRALLARLSPEERANAVEGLALLARAADSVPRKNWSAR